MFALFYLFMCVLSAHISSFSISTEKIGNNVIISKSMCFAGTSISFLVEGDQVSNICTIVSLLKGSTSTNISYYGRRKARTEIIASFAAHLTREDIKHIFATMCELLENKQVTCVSIATDCELLDLKIKDIECIPSILEVSRREINCSAGTLVAKIDINLQNLTLKNLVLLNQMYVKCTSTLRGLACLYDDMHLDVLVTKKEVRFLSTTKKHEIWTVRRMHDVYNIIKENETKYHLWLKDVVNYHKSDTAYVSVMMAHLIDLIPESFVHKDGVQIEKSLIDTSHEIYNSELTSQSNGYRYIASERNFSKALIIGSNLLTDRLVVFVQSSVPFFGSTFKKMVSFVLFEYMSKDSNCLEVLVYGGEISIANFHNFSVLNIVSNVSYVNFCALNLLTRVQNLKVADFDYYLKENIINDPAFLQICYRQIALGWLVNAHFDAILFSKYLYSKNTSKLIDFLEESNKSINIQAHYYMSGIFFKLMSVMSIKRKGFSPYNYDFLAKELLRMFAPMKEEYKLTCICV